ncbi:insulinase family protein [Candidatus Peregrinibacteria bacterium]|jgi:predicted Zn-dependent peptidase|nr:insulinase family protein [Candidatus Peregrinibacteria bacterium]MBT4631701.1 insulinase family protein [Candidatus Peregrinibacteria bacterium]MBT5516635.1 insulinase family protein [Candidatus Peregrinibacteria bacterium]MBT5823981.1 insulinase family protein [Candidatus Peregrinibacteria bacterium]
MHRKTTLTNGLRVLTESLEGTKAVTALVLVQAGSRWETPEINGISHFLEHMFFKGAKKYKSPKEVSEAIDSVGGQFNAFTGKEYAGYYVKLAADKAELALDVLSDMMLHARFDDEEIEKERGVIKEEYNMYQDTPMYQVAWNFERAIFGDQPLGWDEIGTKEIIDRLNRDDFVAYKEALYMPSNMVVCLSGAVDHDEAVAMVEKYFPMEAKERDRKMANLIEGIGSEERVSLQKKNTEQSHLVCGVKAVAAEHEDYYAHKVLAAVLGGNMSSRMFQVVREEKGLAYYISCGVESYLDTGTFYTRAGVNVDQIDDAITGIIEEYDKVRLVDVPESELKKAKEFLKGTMTLALEDSETLGQLLARHELLYGEVKTFKDISALIDAVTVEDLKRVAETLFTNDALYLAVIGPYEDKERFEKLLKF